MAETVAGIKRTRHTKVPVYRERRDEIVGILHARDLLGMDLEVLQREPGQLLKIMRELCFVPETKSASDLLHTFRKRRLSVALAVDEKCHSGQIPHSNKGATSTSPHLLMPVANVEIK